MITIQRDENEYVEELEAARRDWGDLKGTNGKVVPDAVWERLLTDISDGCIRTISSDSHPRAVLEDMTESGVWGPIESFPKQKNLFPLLKAARELWLLRRHELKFPTPKDIRDFIRAHPEEVMERWGEYTRGGSDFWYPDPSGKYGIAICTHYGIGVHIRYNPTRKERK